MHQFHGCLLGTASSTMRHESLEDADLESLLASPP